jgi:hypothetical protein
VITPFGLRHIGLMRELQSTSVLLDPKSALLETPPTPLRTALRGYVLKSSGTFTYVLHAPDDAATWRGFVQAQACKSGPAWKIARMAPALDSSEDAATIWYRLLLHVCIAAGERHLQRLFVRLPQDSPAEEVFKQASFALYCHERVFECTENIARGELSDRMRPVRPEDQRDVQRLYQRVTPRPVAHAEQPGDTRNGSSSLEMPAPGSLQGYVLYGQNGEIAGYLQVATGPRGSWLRLVAQPDRRDGVAEMLDHALAVLGDGPCRPLYCTVREYEGGIQALLEERGFAFVDACSLMVKHTTVHVREAHRKLVPALEKRAGVAPTVSHSESGAVGNG